jgi:hypothetical protein
MKLQHVTLALALLAPTAPVAAQTATVHNAGLLPGPASRIVGTWRSEVALQPCGGGPTVAAFTTLVTYHAGGTLSDTNSSPPALRSPGHGLWRFVGNSQYRARFQMFLFLPGGEYDGYNDVQTKVILGGGNGNTSSVVVRRYNADGSLRAQLCGDGVGERLGFD